jgi:hypothetical protein
MLTLLTIPVVLSCATVLDIACLSPPTPQQVFSQSTVTLIADSREENERREQDLREHETAAAAQRSRELRERAADTAKESHDEKIPARNAHDFYKSF